MDVWHFVLLVAGAGLGAAGSWFIGKSRLQNSLKEIEQQSTVKLREADQKAQGIISEAEVTAQKKLLETMERFEKETAGTRNELKAAEKRLEKREDTLDKKLDVLDTKERNLDRVQADIAKREQEIEANREEANRLLESQKTELLRIAGLSREEARKMCLAKIENEVEHDAGQIVERIIQNAEDNAKEKARYITIGAIQRFAADHTCEAVVRTVDVPSDDMKGRVIGREGRNIRAFEKATGVTVIVDDTPGVVTISCYDPVRQQIAARALDRLIRDGRIHPTRIDEVIAEVTKEVEASNSEAGKHAALEANVNGVNKKLLDVLGRLQFRTSYGQNVLKHSIEVAHLCGLMAAELGLDEALARRCGLLHDIGKAIPHDEAEGSHTKTGADLARRYNEPAPVLNAIGGHHNDIPATHPYTPLVTAADAISAARPGGRRESLERYVKRLQELEGIATSFEGVKLAYAIEAGREVRVIVDPVRTDDRSSLKMARDIAKKIEEQLVTFPGEIKVTVMREVRATEFAISGRGKSEFEEEDEVI
ncbi:MAG: ribonuclease Y [Phycisphaerae bacterium]